MKINIKLGVLMTLISAFAYAVLTSIVKLESTQIPTPVIVFIQSAVTLILFMPILFKQGFESAKKTVQSKNIHLHFLRTLFSLGISYFLFLAVSYIPLVNAVLLVNTAPLIVPFIGYFFVTKKMNHKLWLPLLVGFIGIVLVLHPGKQFFEPASLLALAGGLCMASSMMLVRATSKTDSSLTVTFYYFLFSTLISGLIAIFYWVPLSHQVVEMLVVEGALFFIVQFALAFALRYAPAELVSSLYYSNIIFAALIGIVIWKMSLTVGLILGIILTCLGGLLCIRIQSRAAKTAA